MSKRREPGRPRLFGIVVSTLESDVGPWHEWSARMDITW